LDFYFLPSELNVAGNKINLGRKNMKKLLAATAATAIMATTAFAGSHSNIKME
jgi:hypothetical protein